MGVNPRMIEEIADLVEVDGWAKEQVLEIIRRYAKQTCGTCRFHNTKYCRCIIAKAPDDFETIFMEDTGYCSYWEG